MMHMARKQQSPTHAQELVALRTGRDLAEYLRELYVDQELSQGAIADLLGVSRLTVAMWLREFGIDRSDRKAALA